jgi:hypothetical protein
MMEQFKQIEPLGRRPWRKDREKAQQWARSPHIDLRKKAGEVGEQFRRESVVLHDFAGKILDLDLEDPSTVKEPADEQFMLSWLSWFKYGKTWKELQHERTAGKWWASQRILAVFKDFEKWKFGRLDPNDMRFKMDRAHFDLMAFGLDFGLDKLTADELVNCFDALCTCGMEQHDPENLTKLRKRIYKTLDKLDAKTAALKPGNT